MFIKNILSNNDSSIQNPPWQLATNPPWQPQANTPWQPPTNPPWQFTTNAPDGIIFSDGYWYWSGFYYFYFCLIMIICIGAIAGALSCQKRLAEQKRRARQHAQVNSQGNDANNGNGLTPTSYPSNTEKTMQSADCPPTYENAMANCIDAEQQSREMEQSVINGGGMTVAASTTTIETCISEIDLRTTESATNETIININNVIAKPTQQ